MHLSIILSWVRQSPSTCEPCWKMLYKVARCEDHNNGKHWFKSELKLKQLCYLSGVIMFEA